MWRGPKVRDTFLGVPTIRIIVFGGLYWGPRIYGNYRLSTRRFKGSENFRAEL